MNNYSDRREFLRSLGALSAFGLASRLDLVNFVASAHAQAASVHAALQAAVSRSCSAATTVTTR